MIYVNDSQTTCQQGHSQTVTEVTIVTGPRGANGAQQDPKGLQDVSQKGSGPGKGCESKGRCGLSLRKRKKIGKKNQSKGVLRALGGPQGPRGAKKRALLSPRGV
jgi:hypothetical protein